MRKAIIIVLLLCANALWGQNVVLYDVGVTCHTNMENYIRFYAKGVNENKLVFTTDSGKVTRYRNRLVFKTNRTGIAHFKVYKRRRGKLMLYDSVEVMVYENKYAEVRIGTKLGGDMEKRMLIANSALIAGVWTRESHTDPIGIESYTVIFHKSDGTVLVQKNTGNRFNEGTIQIMKELQSGERISFTNIQLNKSSYWPELEAKPIEFTIL
jgi:hypothetical protein